MSDGTNFTPEELLAIREGLRDELACLPEPQPTRYCFDLECWVDLAGGRAGVVTPWMIVHRWWCKHCQALSFEAEVYNAQTAEMVAGLSQAQNEKGPPRRTVSIEVVRATLVRRALYGFAAIACVVSLIYLSQPSRLSKTVSSTPSSSNNHAAVVDQGSGATRQSQLANPLPITVIDDHRSSGTAGDRQHKRHSRPSKRRQFPAKVEQERGDRFLPGKSHQAPNPAHNRGNNLSPIPTPAPTPISDFPTIALVIGERNSRLGSLSRGGSISKSAAKIIFPSFEPVFHSRVRYLWVAEESSGPFTATVSIGETLLFYKENIHVMEWDPDDQDLPPDPVLKQGAIRHLSTDKHGYTLRPGHVYRFEILDKDNNPVASSNFALFPREIAGTFPPDLRPAFAFILHEDYERAAAELHRLPQTSPAYISGLQFLKQIEQALDEEGTRNSVSPKESDARAPAPLPTPNLQLGREQSGNVKYHNDGYEAPILALQSATSDVAPQSAQGQNKVREFSWKSQR